MKLTGTASIAALRAALSFVFFFAISSGFSLQVWGWYDNREGQLWAPPISAGSGLLNRPPGNYALNLGSGTLDPIAASTGIGGCTYLLNADGRVLASGRSEFGQLGNGAGNPTNSGGNLELIRSIASGSAPLESVIQLSQSGVAGAEHMVALLASGTAVAWGRMHYQMDQFCGAGTAIGPGIGAGIGHPNNPANTFTDLETPQPLLTQHNTGRPYQQNIKSVATSGGATYLLLADGQVLSFGVNLSGELGRTSTLANSADPLPVVFDVPSGQPQPLIKEIAAGWSMAAFLDSRGFVWMAGDNTYGQLGRAAGGSTAAPASGGGAAFKAWKVSIPNLPTIPPTVVRFKSIATAHMTTFGLMADGRVMMWGDDLTKIAGGGHHPVLPKFVQASSGGALTNVMKMWGGQYQMYFLLANGEVWAFGRQPASFPWTLPIAGAGGQQPLPYGQVQATAKKLDWGGFFPPSNSVGDPSQGVIGGTGGILLQATGRAVGWGSNGNSQLGLITGSTDPNTVDPVVHPIPAMPRSDLRFRSYSTSSYHSLAIDYRGRVWAAGDESTLPGTPDAGFLGNGPGPTQRTRFVQSLQPNGSPVENAIQVEACFGNSYALLASGRIVGWGRNPGKTQSGATAPVHTMRDYTMSGSPSLQQVDLRGRIIQITSAGVTTYLLLDDGTVWGRGGNSSKQLGTGVSGQHSNSWVRVNGLDDIIEISAAFAMDKPENVHLAALRADGRVMTLGANMSQQLGHSGTVNQAQPNMAQTAVGGPVTNIKAIAAGNGSFTLALNASGNVFSWGSDSQRECGHPASNGQPREPGIVQVPAAQFRNVKAIAAGDKCASLLTADGKIFAWGSNTVNQVGNSNLPSTPQPVAEIVLAYFMDPQSGLPVPFKQRRYYQLHQGSDANCAIAITATND